MTPRHARIEFDIALGALTISMGLVLPTVFHAAGLGPAFSPMLLPLLIGAFFVRPWLAAFVGAATPCLSMLVTGMPPAPILAVMVPEAAAMCGMTALCCRRFGWGLWGSLIAGIVTERLVLAIAIVSVVPLLGLPGDWFTIGALVGSLPGVGLQFVLVPIVVRQLRRSVPGGTGT